MSSVPMPAARLAKGTTRRGKSSIARQEAIIAYLFLAPWIVGFVVFVAGPIIASLGLSLSTYDIVKPPVFIGLDNYVRAFTADSLFYSSILRTVEYALVIVPVGVGAALLVALLLNQSLRFTNVYRTVFFLPHLTPVVAAVFIWTWLLQPQYGFVNEALFRQFHIIGPGWFLAKEWAIPSLILVALWGTIGGNMMMISLAGLQGVPKDLYDVASIDGAGPWQRFVSITLPMISPTLFFNTVLAIIGALQTFTTAFIATQGGPAYASWFYALHIYTTAFQNGEYGYAAALAWLFFAVLVGFTFVQFRASTRWVYYASEVE